MSTTDVQCKNCETKFAGELPSEPASERIPCPICGSTERIANLGVNFTTTFGYSASAQISITTYPKRLLSFASDLVRQEEYSIAVVVAHMACEVAVERVVSVAMVDKGLDFLKKAGISLLNGYSLANRSNLKLYVALTGDTINKAEFWEEFMASAGLRNKIVHGVKTATKEHAQASILAADAFVAHLSQGLPAKNTTL